MHQIADWLGNLGMSEHALFFFEKRIHFCLPDLIDQGLGKLGIVLGGRCKILRAIIVPLMLIAIAGTAVAGTLEDGYSALNEGDYATALQIFCPLAKEGNVAALKAIAIINDYGRAADKGDGLAQFSMGFIYERGLGLPQDYARAYMWFSLAATQGTKGAAEWRERLAAGMSGAQIAEAQKLASEWKPKP